MEVKSFWVEVKSLLANSFLVKVKHLSGKARLLCMNPSYVKNLLKTLSLVKNAKVNPLWAEVKNPLEVVKTQLAKLSGKHVEEKIPNENLLLMVPEKIPDEEERIAFAVGVKTF